MPLVTVQELIDAGVHYGHQASRWNPKMRPFIYGKRHNIHIINLQETIRGLYQACHFVRTLTSTGAQIMFLGTKRQIRAVVESEAARCEMPAVTERWIGGTLTNFSTVRERLDRLIELETMEADGVLERHKKKAQSTLRREMRKIRRNLEGVRELNGTPSAIIIIDPRREDIAVKEAARMNVPVICVLDTDCDPGAADIVIPANDDAMSSVRLILSRLADAIVAGRSSLDETTLAAAEKQAKDDPRNRAAPGRREPGRQPGRGPGRGGPARGPGRGPGRPTGGGGPGGPRRGPPPPGGRLGRQSKGRFADRLGGHADSISLGGSADESKSAAPVEGQPPAAPVEGQQPAAPVEGQQPAAPVEGQQPAAPVEGQQPAAPVEGQQPAAPVEPDAPAQAPETAEKPAEAPAPEAPAPEAVPDAPAPEAPAPEQGGEGSSDKKEPGS